MIAGMADRCPAAPVCLPRRRRRVRRQPCRTLEVAGRVPLAGNFDFVIIWRQPAANGTFANELELKSSIPANSSLCIEISLLRSPSWRKLHIGCMVDTPGIIPFSPTA
jgi:hypothetical protein